MPSFKYVGDDGRYYVNEGVEAKNGDVHDFESAPDFRWEPVEGDKPADDKQPEQPATEQPAQPVNEPVTAPPAEPAQPAAEQPAQPAEGK